MTDREHVLFSVAFAVARLPKSLLQRLQREHVKDEPVREAAERIVAQIELGNIRYHLGPPGPAPTTSFGGRPRE